MILVFKQINYLNNELSRFVQERLIVDFRITLNVNGQINVIIFHNECYDKRVEKVFIKTKAFFELIDEERLQHDSYYSDLFNKLKDPNSQVNRIDLGYRRRLSHIIDKFNCPELMQYQQTPIVTFYSYKGGLGRSTTLASFASYLSIHCKYKVLILDCDFEAPGYSNFYGIGQSSQQHHNGIVEYLMDSQYEQNVNVEDYVLEIDKEYSGEGSIYMMLAGNLDESIIEGDNHLLNRNIDHYLEGLARLDITDSEHLVNKFTLMLNKLESSKYSPDVILVDSRTGFNDIFAFLANGLSKINVGFFGNNKQTLPGLYFFIENSLKNRVNKESFIVNAINDDWSLFNEFKEDIDQYILELFEADIDDDPPIIECFNITRNSTLSKIGTSIENKDNFIHLISRKAFNDYNDLFNSLQHRLKDSISKQLLEETKEDVDRINAITNVSDKNVLDVRKNLLNTMKEECLDLYAEDIIFTDEYLDKYFYYRVKMYNIFQKKHFLLIGSKGTGKTFLYKALQNEKFMMKLKSKAQIMDKIITIPLVSVQSDHKRDRLFTIAKWIKVDEIKDPEVYFNAFWIVYLWHVIFIEIKNRKIPIERSFIEKYMKPITDTSEMKIHFDKCINNYEVVNYFEKCLKYVDNWLYERKTKLLILIDQLDFVALPIHWDKCVSPLIKYWRTSPFENIYSKIFIRTDLFNKLRNITNKQELKSQNIDLEWDKDEIMSFFFKWVFASVGNDFRGMLKYYENNNLVKKGTSERSFDNNQIPVNKDILLPYVNSFFGESADRRGDNIAFYGSSYEWFFRNLKNADSTMSIRPLLDLIKKAIDIFMISNDSNVNPILSPLYYASPDARGEAVKNHFNDLAAEAGNKDLQVVIDYFRDLPHYSKYKYNHFLKREFYEILREIIRMNQNITHDNPDDLKDLLIVNGIISEKHTYGGRKKYSIAYLYKYFLGLKTRKRQN